MPRGFQAARCKTTDGGSTWHTVNAGLTPPQLMFALAVDPSLPSTLYLGADNGVFKSTNGGATWKHLYLGVGFTSVVTLAIDPATPSTLYAGRRITACSEARTAVTPGMPSTGASATPTFGLSPSVPARRARSTPAYFIRASSRAPTAETIGAPPTPACPTRTSAPSPSIHAHPARSTSPHTVSVCSKSTDGGSTWNAANAGLGDPLPALSAPWPLIPPHRAHCTPASTSGCSRARTVAGPGTQPAWGSRPATMACGAGRSSAMTATWWTATVATRTAP